MCSVLQDLTLQQVRVPAQQNNNENVGKNHSQDGT